jgi:hypothetical protein
VTDTRDLEELLCGLHALIVVHFAKEEEIYLPSSTTSPTTRFGRCSSA